MPYIGAPIATQGVAKLKRKKREKQYEVHTFWLETNDFDSLTAANTVIYFDM